VLFLLRPRQTWMPYALPRSRTEQDLYNREQQDAYASTRRVAPYRPESSAAARHDPYADLKELAQLHQSGALSDAEFASAKAKILSAEDGSA
jgi:Short C-terminal domain